MNLQSFSFLILNNQCDINYLINKIKVLNIAVCDINFKFK